MILLKFLGMNGSCFNILTLRSMQNINLRYANGGRVESRVNHFLAHFPHKKLIPIKDV